jgi:hypothetical protein
LALIVGGSLASPRLDFNLGAHQNGSPGILNVSRDAAGSALGVGK